MQWGRTIECTYSTAFRTSSVAGVAGVAAQKQSGQNQ
jgi:hypothetical protein